MVGWTQQMDYLHARCDLVPLQNRKPLLIWRGRTNDPEYPKRDMLRSPPPPPPPPPPWEVLQSRSSAQRAKPNHPAGSYTQDQHQNNTEKNSINVHNNGLSVYSLNTETQLCLLAIRASSDVSAFIASLHSEVSINSTLSSIAL